MIWMILLALRMAGDRRVGGGGGALVWVLDMVLEDMDIGMDMTELSHGHVRVGSVDSWTALISSSLSIFMLILLMSILLCPF